MIHLFKIVSFKNAANRSRCTIMYIQITGLLRLIFLVSAKKTLIRPNFQRCLIYFFLCQFILSIMLFCFLTLGRELSPFSRIIFVPNPPLSFLGIFLAHKQKKGEPPSPTQFWKRESFGGRNSSFYSKPDFGISLLQVRQPFARGKSSFSLRIQRAREGEK